MQITTDIELKLKQCPSERDSENKKAQRYDE
jgi:hypothetical protein